MLGIHLDFLFSSESIHKTWRQIDKKDNQDTSSYRMTSEDLTYV